MAKLIKGLYNVDISITPKELSKTKKNVLCIKLENPDETVELEFSFKNYKLACVQR